MNKSSLTLGAPLASLCALVLATGCGASSDTETGAEGAQTEDVGTATEAATTSAIKHVFVIAMENHDASQIYGDTTDAPYINNTLLPAYAHSTNFNDELALSIPSEPHYVWMEAGTNAFSDHTFTSDSDPSSSNSTSNTSHLATQINNATNGVTWRTYQEGLNSSTGSCPIHSSGFYAAKHDPFVFYKDVAGSPPSASNAYCVAHHRAYSAFASDLAAGDVASYTFITPNLCNDMHGASGCPNSNLVQSGDNWLKSELPRLISYVNANAGVIFITWDEGSSTLKMPFIAVGPGVKAGYTGTVSYNHSSIIKSVEAILNLSTLSKVSSANALSDLFQSGQYP
ncbi:MAG TPA: alkaline phosphatase family protein [Polyangiaceae bacterium]|nr:alkaline phosphatase family protein [Polyangiaceae bacterium]